MLNFIKRLVRRPSVQEFDARDIGSGISLVECSGDSNGGTEQKFYFSILSPDQIFKHGLVPQAIVGEYREPLDENASIERAKFSANTVFKDFMHKIIADCGDLPDVVREASRIGRGLVTVIDQRVPDMNAAIKPDDILGGFSVENGEVIGYMRNPNHVLLNDFGFFSLESSIKTRLVAALEELGAKS
jgi:hypothetical protein